MVEISNVSLTIGKAQILKNIEYRLCDGTIYGLVGANGCGKTMLMKCICGFIRPTEGKIVIDGKELGKDCEFAPDAGFLIEIPGFIPTCSGYRNLKQLAALRGDVTKEKILHSMELAGIAYAAHKKVSSYSLGMRQRLGIAQAIMGNPKLYILDEPMNALDKNGIARIRDYLLEEKEKGKTILLASHNHEDIEVLCDVILEMEEGCLLQ
ncbi:MAG: ATP-binding cassette domain-containing protein [Lachnospiraceae bacterium]|nr:ATP-binding cassette domain-containing protein [Lachnospiraceae bacterium]